MTPPLFRASLRPFVGFLPPLVVQGVLRIQQDSHLSRCERSPPKSSRGHDDHDDSHEINHDPVVTTAAQQQRTHLALTRKRRSTATTTSLSIDSTNDFPNLSRLPPHSLLKQHLTPQLWQELRQKKTRLGVTIEDIIRPGVTLPASDNTRVAVVCGDAESYSLFAPLLDAILTDHHRHKGGGGRLFRRRGGMLLQRHTSNLDYKGLDPTPLDPDRSYILYTRLRLARSLQGLRFVPCQSRAERRFTEELIRDICTTDSFFARMGTYRSVLTLSNAEYNEAVQKQTIFALPDEFSIHANMARDWPDGRGFYLSSSSSPPTGAGPDSSTNAAVAAGTTSSGNLQMWVNAWDHLWIISTANGGNVQDVFTRLSKAVWALETSLQNRGHAFCEDNRLGFLNSSPANIGTALRASVYVKLVRLGKHNPAALERLCHRLRLELRPAVRDRYTGIFDIANEQALGKSEVELINIMIKGVRTLIELEKRLEKGEDLSEGDIVSA